MGKVVYAEVASTVIRIVPSMVTSLSYSYLVGVVLVLDVNAFELISHAIIVDVVLDGDFGITSVADDVGELPSIIVQNH